MAYSKAHLKTSGGKASPCLDKKKQTKQNKLHGL
jgi:hypothetical protein